MAARPGVSLADYGSPDSVPRILEFLREAADRQDPLAAPKDLSDERLCERFLTALAPWLEAS